MIGQLKAMAEVEGVGYQTILKRLLGEALSKSMVSHIMVAHDPQEGGEQETSETTDDPGNGAPEDVQEPEPPRADADDLSEGDLKDIFKGV